MMKKVIIFDMDGTLYNIDDVIGMNYNIQVQFLKEHLEMDAQSINRLFVDNDIYSYKSNKAKSCTELFLKMGIRRDEWSKYRETYFDCTVINRVVCVNNELIGRFREQGDLVLLSSNSIHNILSILKHLGIDRKKFSDIVCLDYNKCKTEFNKKEAMAIICNEYMISPENMWSIGDRLQTDIIPVIENGGNGILISCPDALSKVVADFEINNLNSCKEYEYFSCMARKEKTKSEAVGYSV